MSLVLFKQDGPVGWLTLNNPDNLNAMTEAMGRALEAIVPQINQTEEIRVVILSGAGRAFSAGGDFDFILKHTNQPPEANQRQMIEFYSRFLVLRDIEVPTIAMIGGHAIGAGFLIALACDLRYAAKEAKMAANFAKIGLSSGMGGLYWLTRLAGPARAAELLLTGRTITAVEAEKIGLINEVCEREHLESKVQEVAHQIVANAPVALKIIKKGIQLAAQSNLEEVLQYESKGQAGTFQTSDLQEGIRAIREKRSPNFQGK